MILFLSSKSILSYTERDPKGKPVNVMDAFSMSRHFQFIADNETGE